MPETRPRTWAGSASARGGSATTTDRCRAWGARGVPGRLRGRRRQPAGPRPPAVVGGDGQRQVGGDLRPPGPRPPDRPPPKPRAGVARPPDLRARVGSPGADRDDSGPPGCAELLDALAEYLFADVREWVPRERALPGPRGSRTSAPSWRASCAPGSEPLREDLRSCSSSSRTSRRAGSLGRRAREAVRAAERSSPGASGPASSTRALTESRPRLREHVAASWTSPAPDTRAERCGRC